MAAHHYVGTAGHLSLPRGCRVHCEHTVLPKRPSQCV
jgi:hypothetical protein